jgi:outer membrane cobalamin receptor
MTPPVIAAGRGDGVGASATYWIRNGAGADNVVIIIEGVAL